MRGLRGWGWRGGWGWGEELEIEGKGREVSGGWTTLTGSTAEFLERSLMGVWPDSFGCWMVGLE